MTILPNLRESQSWNQDVKLIEYYIKQKARTVSPLNILEAGCGRTWSLNLGNTQYILTGVDIDKTALEIRKNVRKDLDEAIVGDLRYVDIDENQFDVIYCSFVLEHIKDAGVALHNFSKWIKPGGLLILKIPDPHSVRGFLTRVTPHWFHIFYCKYIARFPNAGKLGHGPYVTYYDPIVSRMGIHDFCKRYSFVIEEERGDGGYNSYGRGLSAFLTVSIVRLVALLSFGKLTPRHANLLYILEKHKSPDDI